MTKDRGHGQRGAEFAPPSCEVFDISDAEFRLLYKACAGHDHGMVDELLQYRPAGMRIASIWEESESSRPNEAMHECRSDAQR